MIYGDGPLGQRAPKCQLQLKLPERCKDLLWVALLQGEVIQADSEKERIDADIVQARLTAEQLLQLLWGLRLYHPGGEPTKQQGVEAIPDEQIDACFDGERRPAKA